MRKSRRRLLALLAVSSGFVVPVPAESGPPEATAALLQDSRFWKAYNECDVQGMGGLLAPDVEFYHDRGGVTLGAAALATSLRDGICSRTDSRLRREAVDGTVQVFPLEKANAVYGVIVSGEHVFYRSETGKGERAEERARFTTLWLLEAGTWKMARALSYDHRPAPYVSVRASIALQDSALDRYVGSYQGARSGPVVVLRGSGALVLSVGGKQYTLFPERDGFFFSKERDLTFEFLGMDNGQPSRIVVRDRGEIAEEAVRDRTH